MAVHDVGGPIGFLVATRRPERFRALAISNTFGWPMAGYTAVRRMLKIIASLLFGTVNDLTNAVALFTASRYGVGRHLSKADRRSFLGSWRSRSRRRSGDPYGNDPAGRGSSASRATASSISRTPAGSS